MNNEHTPTPWITFSCGEMWPNDFMIVADLGKNSDGIKTISTVARVLSIRQTKEVTAANAAFIVKAVNSHYELVEALSNLIEHSDKGTYYVGDRSLSDAMEAGRKVLAKIEK